MIGCDLDAIERGEDRKLFNEAMAEIGLEVALGLRLQRGRRRGHRRARGLSRGAAPSFTLGGAGGGIAHTHEELISS